MGGPTLSKSQCCRAQSQTNLPCLGLGFSIWMFVRGAVQKPRPVVLNLACLWDNLDKEIQISDGGPISIAAKAPR